MIVPASTAWAEPYNGECENNEVCVYKDADFNRPKFDFKYGYYDSGGCPDCHTYNSPITCNNIFSTKCLLNDSVSSMHNLSSYRHVRFFTNKGYSGSSQTAYAGWRISQAGYNDGYSSHCWSDVSYCGF